MTRPRYDDLWRIRFVVGGVVFHSGTFDKYYGVEGVHEARNAMLQGVCDHSLYYYNIERKHMDDFGWSVDK